MKYLTFFLFALLSFGFSGHPIYISVLEGEYKAEGQRLELSLKVFADDLELALSKEQNQTIEVATNREPKDLDSYIQEYLAKHLLLRSEKGEELSWKYIGREYERKDFFVIWLYVLVEQVPRNTTALSIRYSLLMDHIPGQHNILTLNSAKGKKRFSLWKNKPYALWEL